MLILRILKEVVAMNFFKRHGVEDLFIVLNNKKKLHVFVQFFLEKKTRFYTTTLATCVHIKFFFILGLLRLEENVNTKCLKGDYLIQQDCISH